MILYIQRSLIQRSMVRQSISACALLLLLATPEWGLAFTGPESAPPATAQSQPLPDSPGAVRTQTTVAQNQTPESTSAPSQSQSPSPTAAPQNPFQTQAPKQTPLGTAAAEVGNTSGTAASKPAGVAVAPARQRRSRSLIIKLGAIFGASAAIGTVVALSAATPSKPPGAR